MNNPNKKYLAANYFSDDFEWLHRIFISIFRIFNDFPSGNGFHKENKDMQFYTFRFDIFNQSKKIESFLTNKARNQFTRKIKYFICFIEGFKEVGTLDQSTSKCISQLSEALNNEINTEYKNDYRIFMLCKYIEDFYKKASFLKFK